MPIIETNISAVTVYQDRARVTRTAKTDLAVGQHTLTILNLPDRLDEKSVRVSGRGHNVKILSVEVNKRFFNITPDEKIADLEQKIKENQLENKVLDDNLATLSNRMNSLNQLQQNITNTFPQALGYGRTSIESLDNALKYLNKEVLDVQSAMRELGNKKQEIVGEINFINTNLVKLKTGETKSRWEVQVLVEAESDSTLELDVTYLVTGASWSPLYDVRLLENKITLTYLANVVQQTGEEWLDVLLSLSTAKPATSRAIPELTPWYIPEKPKPQSSYNTGSYAAPFPVASAGGLGGIKQQVERTAPPPPPPEIKMETATIETSSSGTSVTYRVPKSTNVPNDGSPHKTMVALLPLEVKLDYVTVPKLAPEAYLRATVKNISEFILLPGTVNIFHDQDFVGTTNIQTIAQNEEFKLQLGVDKRIKISRKLAERSVSKTFLGGSKRYNFTYLTTITSNLKTPTKIVVHDQLPIAYTETIKVKAGDILPKPTEQDDMQMLKWELDFKAEEKREISTSFVLETPREMNIPGID